MITKDHEANEGPHFALTLFVIDPGVVHVVLLLFFLLLWLAVDVHHMNPGCPLSRSDLRLCTMHVLFSMVFEWAP